MYNLSVLTREATLLNNITFDVVAGEVLAIIGPNGAGKTTLLNGIANALSQEMTIAGQISVCGKYHHQWQALERARHLALLPQSSLLNFPYTVTEVVQLGRIPHQTGKGIDTAIIAQSLKALDIAHLQQRVYTQLSGGEQQRVQLARVMTQIWRSQDAQQRLLLLDEPTASLDLGHQQQLMEKMREFAHQNVGIVMVVHDINLALRYADRILALSCGEMVALGEPVKVINAALIKQLYQAEVTVTTLPDEQCPVVYFR